MFRPKDNGLYIDAYVLAVDLRRGVCKCRTHDGKMLSNVQWGRPLGMFKEAGDNYGPMPNEQVVITYVASEPIILFSKSSLNSLGNTIRARVESIVDTDPTLDNYNFSVLGDNHRSEGSSPEQIVPGDRVITNERGSLIGLLRSGTVILKASALAQIFMTKFDDLVRIVSRNYEQFSDSLLHVQTNIKGKLYTYTGFFKETTSSRNETPEYYEVVGNTEVGLAAKNDPLNVDLEAVVETDVVKKQVVAQYSDVGSELTPRWVHTLDINGEASRGSYSASNTMSVVEEVKNGELKWTVTDGTDTTTITVVPGSISIVTTGAINMQCDTASVEVAGNASIEAGTANLTVNGNYTETINGNLTRTITGNLIETVASNRTIQTGGNTVENSAGSHTITGNPVIVP